MPSLSVHDDDGLDPAQGCLTGAVLGGIFWVAIFGGLAILIAKCVQ